MPVESISPPWAGTVGPESVSRDWLWAWRGLRFAIVPETERPANRAVGQSETPVMEGTFVIEVAPSPVGRVVRHTSTSNAEGLSYAKGVVGAAPYTLALFGRRTNAAAAGPMLWMGQDGGTDEWTALQFHQSVGAVLYARSGSSSPAFVSEGTDTLNETDFYLVVGTFDADGNAELWRDGVSVGSSSSLTIAPSTWDQISLLRAADSSPGANPGEIASAYIWDRVLTDAEIRQLTMDPFGPIRPRLWGPELAAPAAGQTVAIGAASESDTAVAVGAVKPILVTIPPAVETDQAEPVTPVKPIRVIVDPVTETDVAEIVDPIKPIVTAIGAATEADVAVAVLEAGATVVTIGAAAETDTAEAVTPRQPIIISIGPATETDLAEAVVPVKGIVAAIAAASETDTAETIAVIQATVAVIGPATETDIAETVAIVKPIVIAIGAVSETDVAEAVLYAALEPGPPISVVVVGGETRDRRI